MITLTRGATVITKGNVLTVLHRTKSRILSFPVLKSITYINPMSITHSKNFHVTISLTMGHGIFQFIFGKLKSPQIIYTYHNNHTYNSIDKAIFVYKYLCYSEVCI